LAEIDTESRAETDPLKYCNRWLRRFADFSGRELEIQLPDSLVDAFTLSIAYSFPTELLNYGALSVYQSRAGSDSRYIQLLGIAVNGHGRFLMPCLDGAAERVANWDLEFSVFAGTWQDCFDRLHVVSSGVLCRQFVNEERTIKVFHYKVQDLPLKPAQISFVAGVFDAVRIPGVPFAYAFGPVGKSAQLAHVTDFLGKAFNFYNWYLNSAGGSALKSLGSLSSEVFPFPSYFVVFLKDIAEPFSAANFSALPSDFLHDGSHIEQTFETRRALCLALAQQYFALRIDLKSVQDSWLLLGMTRYLSELQLRTFHGNNDYRLRVKQDILRLVELEATSENLYIPPLTSLAAHLADQTGKLNPIDRARLQEILHLKSRLVFVLLERKIEWTFLQKILGHLYTESLINRQQREGFSFGLFLKLIKRLTGKDLKSFTDMWISGSGCPQLSLSFLHSRKKSAIEFEVQPIGRNCKYSGNLTVRVQESDIVHEHTIHLDDQTTRFEIPFHSKAKKVRRKSTKAEAEAAASSFDAANDDASKAAEDDSNMLSETLVSPISWIRIDPEMEWLAHFSLHQPDIMWIEALENDRDVVSQLEAVLALPALSEASESVCFALERFINDWKVFYAVRVVAITAMSTIGARLPKENSMRLIGARRLVEVFNKKFGHSNNSLTALPRANNFEIIASVFVQAAIAEGISKAICSSLQAESELSANLNISVTLLDQIVGFFASLLKFNDNSTNAFNDSDYLARIIRAGTTVFARLQDSPRFHSQFTAFLVQLHRYARLEYILPSFRNVVMCAVLEACACLRFPAQEFEGESLLSLQGGLQSLLLPQNSLAVRLETCRLFSQFFREHGYAGDLFTLVQMMFTDRSLSFRLLAAKDTFAFESLQYLMRSMESATEEALRRWCVADFDDRRCLEQLTCSLAALFPPASDEISTLNNPAASTLSTGKLKITFNLHSQPAAAAGAPTANATTAAASPSVDDDDDIWLREISPKKPTSSSSAGAGSTPTTTSLNVAANESEKSKLLRILNALWSNYDSIPFRYPVDSSVPGYHAIIKSPMDLSTIREHCTCLSLFLAELHQMFSNCFTFNQPESLICEQAKRLRELAIAELRDAFPKEKKSIRKVLRGVEAVLPEDDAFSTSPLEGAFRAILARLCKHPLAYFFLEPVDYVALNLPTYPLIVKQPMDFSTIRARLASYARAADFEGDCRLVFENCRVFNAAGTVVHQAAVEIEKLFAQEMEKHFPQESKPKIKISLNLLRK
jgi:hypothetical protein